MKKLLFLVAFVGSAALGGACTNALTEACNDFVSVRNACEAQNADDPPPYSIDLCANIDPECEEFYNCAVDAPCEASKSDGRFRIQATGFGCMQPENKECTDADLRP